MCNAFFASIYAKNTRNHKKNSEKVCKYEEKALPLHSQKRNDRFSPSIPYYKWCP